MKDIHLSEADVLALAGGRPAGPGAEEHRAVCEPCARMVDEQALVWRMLEEVVPTTDAESSWRRIEQRTVSRPLVARVFAPRWLAAAAALIVAVVGGVWFLVGTNGPDDTGLAAGDPSVRVAAVLDLIDRHASGGSAGALVAMLEGDPDEHVRIAAVEALREPVLSGAVPVDTLLRVLRTEASPLVQSDLISLAVEVGERRILPAVRRALSDSVHPFIAAQLAGL